MSEPRPAFRTSGRFLVSAAALAACSLLYELIFAQVIAELTGNATIWESVSMAVFLCGMGIRSLAFPREKIENLASKLVVTEFALVAGAILSFFVVLGIEAVYRIYVYDAGVLDQALGFPRVFVLGIVAQVATFLLGWLSGYELQFFLHWPEDFGFRFKESAVLAAYHFGALGGTAAFVVARRVGIDPFQLLAATTILNLAFAGFIIQRLQLWKNYRRTMVLTFVLLASCLGYEPKFQELILQNHYYNGYQWEFDSSGLKNVQHPKDPAEFLRFAQELPVIHRQRTPFQVLDVVPGRESGDPALFINGRFQVTKESSARYHETFAHVSLGYRAIPAKKVLILGGGDGVLAAELLRHKSVESIDLVEIDPAVLALANDDPAFRELNRNALKDPKVTVHIADAMAFIRGKSKVYDAAFIDLTYPFDFDSARFYSVEFFRIIARSLAEGGILVAGSPFDLVDSPNERLGVLVDATLAAAGFANFVAITNGNDNFVVVGKDEMLPTWQRDPGLQLTDLPNKRIRTTAVRAPVPGPDVLSVMRPRLLMTFDAFY